ncbi:MAG: response regulator [Myxococcales bacterium]|nr:response regulator [Myxococcales bacterium]
MEPSSTPAGAPLEVLLLDGDAAQADRVARLLAGVDGADAQVTHVADRAAALAALDARRCDVVLVGTADGVDFIADASARRPAVPFVLMSDDDDPALDRRALQAGAVDRVDRDVADARPLRRAVRYAAERAHRARLESRFRALIDRAHDLVVVVDWCGVVRFISPSVQRILGYAQAERTGTDMTKDVHPDDLPVIWGAFEEVAQTAGHVVSLVLRLRHADGTYRTIEMKASNHLEDPAVQGIVVNGWDVTERIDLTARHIAAQRLEALGQLAGGVAHDFNNLLTVIRAQTDLVLMDLPPDGPLTADVQSVQDAADRAARLTGQLLAFSRDQIMQPRRVDLCTVVRQTGHLVERVIGETIAVTYDLDEGAPPVVVDPGQLEQVVLNLAVNARDAMPAGGSLVFSVGRRAVCARGGGGPWAVLTVRDTGVGMDAATRARIFEPFFTTKSKGRGTGLGLATVHGVVTQLGGCIEVVSAPGEGTEFVLCFPGSAGPLDAVATPTDAFTLDGGGRRVLVVEDDDAVAQVAVRVLRRAAFQVTRVRDAEAALLALEAGAAFDVLVSDVVLPRQSGLQLVAVARARWPRVRPVLMSGYAPEEAGVGTLPTDLPFVRKPFRPATLVEAVRRATGPLSPAPTPAPVP